MNDPGISSAISGVVLTEAEFISAIAESDWDDTDLNYLAVNTLYPQGATARQVRRDGASAVRTLQEILRMARAIKAADTSDASLGPGRTPSQKEES